MGGCEIAGREVYMEKKEYFFECRDGCFKDPACVGYDYGWGKRNKECYYNYAARPLKTIKNKYFDAWEKLDKPECNSGTLGMHNYDLLKSMNLM